MKFSPYGSPIPLVFAWKSHMGFPLTPRSMTLDDLGLL